MSMDRDGPDAGLALNGRTKLRPCDLRQGGSRYASLRDSTTTSLRSAAHSGVGARAVAPLARSWSRTTASRSEITLRSSGVMMLLIPTL